MSEPLQQEVTILEDELAHVETEIHDAAPAEPAPASEPVAPAPTEPTPAPASAPAPPEPPLPVPPLTAFAATIMAQLARSVAGIKVYPVSLDDDERGGRLMLVAPGADRMQVRYAASILLYGNDGREWKYLSDGPDGETGNSCALLHVSPIH